ncbi:MAG: dihydroneopterin aldolase [Oligoflexus sp.]|nr:dihydroneopterin aldolase [Oligoflexus sp.]
MRVLSQITGRPLDAITLRDLAVQCVIGVHPEEKIRPQALRLDVRLYLDTAPAAMSGILSRTIDYSLVAKQLSFILTHSRFRLLESAAEALALFLLTPPQDDHPIIQAVDIEIKKPEALGGLSEPSIRIFRDLDNRPVWQQKEIAAISNILFQVPEAVIERIVVAPGQTLIMELGSGLALMTESYGFTVNDKIVTAGTSLPAHQAVSISNSDERPKSIIAVTFRGRDRHPGQAAERLH